MTDYVIVTLPHPNFVAKHVCTNCRDTVEDAEAFAAVAHANRRKNGWKLTNKNSVFIASDMIYVTDGYGWTVFEFAVSKYNCILNDMEEWSCWSVGPKRARHDPRNGHYFYRKDID